MRKKRHADPGPSLSEGRDARRKVSGEADRGHCEQDRAPAARRLGEEGGMEKEEEPRKGNKSEESLGEAVI